MLNYKIIRTIFAMFTDNKVTEIFFMADEFCKFFDAMMAKYIISNPRKRKYYRENTMFKAEVMLIIILFHDSTIELFLCTCCKVCCF